MSANTTTQKDCLLLGLSVSKHVPKGTCFDPNKLVAYRRLLARCQMSAIWHSSDSDNLLCLLLNTYAPS
ncbi:MAG: hypothetical protein OYH77_08315 [Pseudomonadota bacterium]|nr:hypothetical protein [Pseudomonadota bacterium]